MIFSYSSPNPDQSHTPNSYFTTLDGVEYGSSSTRLSNLTFNSFISFSSALFNLLQTPHPYFTFALRPNQTSLLCSRFTTDSFLPSDFCLEIFPPIITTYVFSPNQNAVCYKLSMSNPCRIGQILSTKIPPSRKEADI